jgi:hypothetical protein
MNGLEPSRDGRVIVEMASVFQRKMEEAMRYAMLATLAAAGTILTSAASAMPLNNLSATVQNDEAIVQDVRLVCNEWGRCWRTGPRAYYGAYGPSYYYGPSYGYYGRPYRPYGYVGVPGVGLSFGF